MAILLAISAALARRPAFWPVSRAWSHWLARTTIRRRKICQVSRQISDLGTAWQQGFPSPKRVPIEAVTADTVFARIETPCPLRGTGDTAACWRMMEYDRVVAAAAGGQFVVLRSQAEPGLTSCRVALRPASASTEDLVPAHTRIGQQALR
ncbi:hypothetical protein FNB15_11795 [Ferrovibrio terrae]|uniref:Uncharacterized protein n=1 Tax=Ferrovibrio terrae TaxID=2594003 RepID=A0A516H2A1_9PROT|nr:hypothetical protein [Ferrovibrio terrae]QDO97906.1 hypothetical protein FNB15_11795 [Ferrovibrio terrae]